MTPLWISLLACAATLLGGFLVVRRFEWAKRNGDRLTALAAGVLVSLSLVEVIPEAAVRTASAGIWCALGFLAMYFFEHLSGAPHCAGDECPDRDISMIAWIALLAHSLFDGIALFAGFEVSPRIGLLVAAGVLLHEFPEGLASGALLLHRGFSRKEILAMTAAVGAATPLGTLGAFLLLPEGNPADWPYPFLAAIAGTFLYTSVAGLLIHSHRRKDPSIIASFVAGFGAVFLHGLLE